MEILSSALYRLTALSMIAAVGELLLPSGGTLKKGVRLIAGLMVAELILVIARSALPALAG